MAIPFLNDPAKRPGADLFASLPDYTSGLLASVPGYPQASSIGVQVPYANPNATLVQIPEEQPGILGRLGSALKNQRLSQQLLSMGTEMLANSGYQAMPVTTGAGIGRGLQAFGQAGQRYDQMIAQQAADEFNRKIQEAQLKRAEEGDPLKYQFGGGVLTEQDGVKGFAIPVQNPQSGQIESRFVPIGDKIVDRSTGMTAQEKAQLDAWAAGNAERQKLLAKLGLSSDFAEADAEAARLKAEAEAQGRAGVAADVASGEAGRTADYLTSALDNMESLAKGGVYTGGILDKAGKFAAGAGVPFDQGKADRTVQIRQLATDLKLMAKPPGMGAMSDAEWKILQDAIPDPDSVGNVDQLLAGIRQFRKKVEARKNMGTPQGQRQATPSAPKPKVLKWNPATGKVE